jgi:cytoskeleton protein RodZ
MPYDGPFSKSKISVVICRDRRLGLPSFGENLRREREKRKITLDQISQSTKIGTRMLQALEEDKFNQLPGGIFNKGFVRAYARVVGLDEEQTIADYLEASGEAAPVMPEMPPAHPAPRIIEAAAETPRRPLPWGMFAALLLLAALALSLWSHRQKQENVITPSSPQPSAAQPSPQPAATQPPASVPPPTAGRSSPAVTRSPSTASLPQPLKPATTESPAPGSAKLPTAPPAAGGFVVNIQAREDSWTVITSDGKTVYSGLLAAGDQRTIRGQNEVVVKAGNSGGVDLYFNGKKVAQPGEFGEVRTITFGPNGVSPNAPPPPPSQ